MKSIRTYLLAFTAAACLALPSSSLADFYTTSFDSPTFSMGNLDSQDGWVAQTQWQADGAGNISNTNGAFIRAHNTGVLGSTAIGESMLISTIFTLGSFTTPSDDIASFEEGILQQGMSHQQGVANFAYGIAAGLFYDVASQDLLFRANQGLNETGTTSVSLGAASGLGGTMYTMTTMFTKTGMDTWQVDATIDDGVNPASVLSYTANGQDSNLDTDSDGGGIIGGIQALPSGGGSGGVATAPFGSTTVSDYSITVVPEPISLPLLGVGVLGILSRRRR